MLQRLRSRFNREEGFTLIELLVVILIIGILAAIAIPSFLNQTDKGTDAEAKSAARTAQTAAETYFTDNGDYADMDADDLRGIESQLPDAGLTVTLDGTDGYTVAVASDTGTTFSIVKAAADGSVTFPCGPAARQGEGGCPTGGFWN